MFQGVTQKLASQLNRLTVFGNVMNCCPHFVLKVLVKRYVENVSGGTCLTIHLYLKM